MKIAIELKNYCLKFIHVTASKKNYAFTLS